MSDILDIHVHGHTYMYAFVRDGQTEYQVQILNFLGYCENFFRLHFGEVRTRMQPEKITNLTTKKQKLNFLTMFQRILRSCRSAFLFQRFWGQCLTAWTFTRISLEVILMLAVLPVVNKADSLQDVQREQIRADIIEKLGTDMFQFTKQSMQAVGAHQDAPPFFTVLGNEVDQEVHPYWLVRKYKWGQCEAFRSRDSDLKFLKQLIFEVGFQELKDGV
eukprot:TRINITY_DN9439_c0_g1_i18.p1 TRINITY_DN9439_c0_g1~~TRINITY_DN9439_c0_g1_i18.p1  ORF type:complete len:218 (+),score=14.92 TRINITY_DN9439_c0_g1_i18:137-790(+)